MTKRKAVPKIVPKMEVTKPPGLEWEKICNHPAIPGEFRKRQIFTLADIQKDVNAALGAVQSAYGQDLAQIIAAARELEKEN